MIEFTVPIDAGYTAQYVWADINIFMLNSYDTDSYTDFYGLTNPGDGIYASRYPFEVEFDFQPSQGLTVSDLSSQAPVSQVSLVHAGNPYLTRTLAASPWNLKFSKTIHNVTEWNSLISPPTPRTGMRQDPDDGLWTGSGYTRVYMDAAWFWAHTPYVGCPLNMKLSVQDATGKKTTRHIEYAFLFMPI